MAKRKKAAAKKKTTTRKKTTTSKAGKSPPGTAQDQGFDRVDGFLLNAVGDAPDFRDFAYQPALLQLKDACPPPTNLEILNQGQEGACTGFGLAAVINRLLAERGSPRRVSPRMLYEMAKKYDEWKGEDYSGSSCRGAVRAWNSMGVCSADLAPYRDDQVGWTLEIEQAKDARATTLGAYYRVGKRLSDYHAALNEAGALYASAKVHAGWQADSVRAGKIPYKAGTIGGHAFAIVGYNQDGFWVQNSWGKSWGKGGLALWTYEDWLANVQDCWVVRLAISTPQIWHLTPPASDHEGTEEGLFKRSPKRAEIVGHFVHIDDGEFDTKGAYWADLRTVEQTAELVAKSTKYDHLLLYAHGGLNSIKASARRIVAMKEVFKSNRIYPFHFMYDTGLLEEIKDLVIGKKKEVEARAGGFTDFTDKLIEKATRQAGRAVWREMKRGAMRPFESRPDGTGKAGAQTIGAFLAAMVQPDATRKKLHMAGHSTGAILLAALLEALEEVDDAPRIESCLLMAPACTHDTFNATYRRLINQRSSKKYGIDRMRIYNLEPELELKDTVTPLYRKSLLYLVSNAFEEVLGERILGMEMFRSRLGTLPGGRVFQIYRSDGTSSSKTRTAARSHGGFDNDVDTMNDILRTVLGKEPVREFTKSDLKY